MKKALAIALCGVLTSVAAQAAGNVGQCVFPKTKMAKNGNLEFKQPIYLSNSPDGADKHLLTSLAGFTIKAERGGYVQLATVSDFSQPDPDKEAGKIVGWAKLSDFRFQDLRNCN
ncbi:MAG: hypothetical protein ACM3VY_00715 [Candidatus Bathyarchaeota archaeon]